MKMMEDTRRTSGLGPMICSAGRTVLAVVCTAPDTRPSTSPWWSIIVPTATGSARVLAGPLLGPAFVPAQLGQRLDVALGDGLRIQHRDALGQPQAEAPGLGG